MVDGYGRKIEYLRLSVTGRCNLCCAYCMPEKEGEEEDVLSLCAMEEIVTAAAALGIRKVRITGGEPLVREDILPLCRRLSAIRGIEELCMTTNGILLTQMAHALREAGVSRLNVSLDTLRADRYRKLTATGELVQVLDGLKTAEEAGFTQTKINAVLLFPDEIQDLAALTLEHAVSLRFIEEMPIGRGRKNISAEEVLRRLPTLIPLKADGVAQVYRLPQSKGTVGIIAPLSRKFCSTCNRIRVTADGMLKPCLCSGEEISLRELHGQALKNALKKGIAEKPCAHHMEWESAPTGRSMKKIGG